MSSAVEWDPSSQGGDHRVASGKSALTKVGCGRLGRLTVSIHGVRVLSSLSYPILNANVTDKTPIDFFFYLPGGREAKRIVSNAIHFNGTTVSCVRDVINHTEEQPHSTRELES